MSLRIHPDRIEIKARNWRALAAFNIVFVTLASLLVGLLASIDHIHPTVRPLTLLLLGLGAVANLYLLQSIGTLLLDTNGITWHPIFRAKRFMAWRDVSGITGPTWLRVLGFESSDACLIIPSFMLAEGDLRVIRFIAPHFWTESGISGPPDPEIELAVQAFLLQSKESHRQFDDSIPRIVFHLIYMPGSFFLLIAIFLLAERNYPHFGNQLSAPCLILSAAFFLCIMASYSHALPSWKHKFMLGFLNILPCLFLPLAVALILNGALDTSEPQTHLYNVVEKKEYGTRRTRAFTVRIRPTDQKDPPISLEVSESEFRRADPGMSRLRITTRSGALGQPWIVNYELE